MVYVQFLVKPNMIDDAIKWYELSGEGNHTGSMFSLYRILNHIRPHEALHWLERIIQLKEQLKEQSNESIVLAKINWSGVVFQLQDATQEQLSLAHEYMEHLWQQYQVNPTGKEFVSLPVKRIYGIYKRDIEILKDAAIHDSDIDAMMILIEDKEFSSKLDKSLYESFIDKGITANNPVALLIQALKYIVETKWKEAYECLQKSAKQGHIEAMNLVARFMTEHEADIEPLDRKVYHQEIVKWLKMCYMRGRVDALEYLIRHRTVYYQDEYAWFLDISNSIWKYLDEQSREIFQMLLIENYYDQPDEVQQLLERLQACV